MIRGAPGSSRGRSSQSRSRLQTPGYAATRSLKTSTLKTLTADERRSLQVSVDEQRLLNYRKSHKSRKNKKIEGHLNHHLILNEQEKAHEIDFVATQHTGTAEARHPNANLLIERSMEIQPSSEGLLSARGITHRSYEHFRNQILLCTNQVRNN